MKEHNIQRNFLMNASRVGFRLFNNPRGRYKDDKGNWHSYGVGPNGAADLIGFIEVEITPEMVGKKVAVFSAVEVKRPGFKPRKEQQQFLTAVRKAGGLADWINSADQADSVLRKFLDRLR